MKRRSFLALLAALLTPKAKAAPVPAFKKLAPWQFEMVRRFRREADDISEAAAVKQALAASEEPVFRSSIGNPMDRQLYTRSA